MPTSTIIIISIFIKIISWVSSYSTGSAQRDQKIWLFGDERLTLLLCCIMSFFYKWSSRGRNKKVSGKDEGAAGQPVESERGMWLMSVSTETVSLNIITFLTKKIYVVYWCWAIKCQPWLMGWAGLDICHPSSVPHSLELLLRDDGLFASHFFLLRFLLLLLIIIIYIASFYILIRGHWI